MELIEQIKNDLKNILSERRYIHSIGVMEMCEELAKLYGVDVEKAKLAGLLHDNAKEMPREKMLKYVEENNIPITEVERINTPILHGKIGADIAKKKNNVDEEIENAIKYHTTGKENMTLLQKVVFVSDKIDETRKYEGVEELRKLAFENLDEAIIKKIDATLKINIEKKNVILEESIKTRNYLLINKK